MQADKTTIRSRHERQREALLRRMGSFLEEWEDALLANFANGREIDPAAIEPEVRMVESKRDNDLFTYATLHWSVPVTGGYGRRSRFVVRDRQNGKLIGVFALSDPVYNLRARDAAIGWTDKEKRHGLYRVLDASVIGAVQPYANLLGGKLIALLAIAKETLETVERKYKGTQTTISRRVLEDTRPLLITTTSALGRSSIYNRLRRPGREFYEHVGWTEGYGHFEVPDDVFSRLVLLLEAEGHPKARAHGYGMGPSWRMRTIRIALEYLGIEPDSVLRHGIKREVFIAPTASNWRGALRGGDGPRWLDDEVDALAQFYRTRWGIPRAARQPDYRSVRKDQMRLLPRLQEQTKL